MPFFTIITPTIQRNGLIKCCESLTKQTFTDWEHIVMVDCAELNPTLINQITHSQRIIWKCEQPHKNFGNTCRHNAYQYVKGQYVIYLDDDNFLMDDAVLADMAQALTDASLPDLAFFPIQDRGNIMYLLPPQEGKIDTANMVVKREFAQWPDNKEGKAAYITDFLFMTELYGKLKSVGFEKFRPVINRPVESKGIPEMAPPVTLNPVFLVSSAVHTKHGAFTVEQRLEQTIKSIQSIRQYLPSAKIILCDSSAEQSLTEQEIEVLKLQVTALLNFHQDTQVQSIYKSTDNWDIVKNYTELVVFGKAIDFLMKTPEFLKDATRVFKLSGRYQLTEQFTKNLEMYSNPNFIDKYIFAQRRASQFSGQVSGGLSTQLMSRLWSWPANKTSLVLARYHLMLEDFLSTLARKQYRDIEHLLLRYFEGPCLTEVQQIGVCGQLGPNSQTVED